MPDLVLVPANILPADGAQYANGIAGVAIAAGDVCCLDTATQKFVLANSNAAATARVRGIAAHTAAIGQPVRLQSGGQMTIGTGLLTVGVLYVLSGATPGKIAPIADLTATDYVTVLGVGQTTANLLLRLWVTELAHG